jgi:hypothetical protein
VKDGDREKKDAAPPTWHDDDGDPDAARAAAAAVNVSWPAPPVSRISRDTIQREETVRTRVSSVSSRLVGPEEPHCRYGMPRVVSRRKWQIHFCD